MAATAKYILTATSPVTYSIQLLRAVAGLTMSMRELWVSTLVNKAIPRHVLLIDAFNRKETLSLSGISMAQRRRPVLFLPITAEILSKLLRY